MQSAGVPWDSAESGRSLQRLRATGATWVALVPFLEQDAADVCKVSFPAATARSLPQAIRLAHAAGLRVALKPQILLPRGWAGSVGVSSEAAWRCWFAQYTAALEQMARLAAEQQVDLLVVGTELKQTEARSEWRPLLARLRQVYSGELSYVFHDPADVPGFAALAELDSVGVSLYPAIGNTEVTMRSRVAATVAELARLQARLGRPLWVAEVGVPSRVAAGDAPWVWNDAAPTPRLPDLQLQATALDIWLAALDRPWLRGVLVWVWMSDPRAGGARDTDFTPQNKPAEAVLRDRWSGRGSREGASARRPEWRACC